MSVSLQNSNALLEATILDRSATPKSKIPQLEDTPVYVYGHSNAALLGTNYLTTGRHWSDLLKETNVGSLVNGAVAGYTMEQVPFAMNSGGAAWPTDTTKKLALVMGIGNSAGATVEATKAINLQSFKNAVETIAAITLGDYISEQLPNAQWSYTAGWSSQSLSSYGGGIGYYTSTNGAYAVYIVPNGVTNKRIWAVFLESDYRGASGFANVTIQRNDGAGPVPVHTGLSLGTSVILSAGNPSFSRRAIDCGVYSAGQAIGIYHAGTSGTQTLFFDGLRMENTRNHVSFVEDNPDWLAPNAPEWALWPGGADFGPARIEEFNVALREQVASINARVPNGASTLSMRDPLWQPTQANQYAMTAADHIHYNDRGNAYAFAKISQGLARSIPWTSRLHSVIVNG